ncbi:hypothetical protein C8R47DRAFT_1146809 [Mycena vitilis]|nr:hypothetical protein C8R47DRAFT_1146809 [Mycena vitilis]
MLLMRALARRAFCSPISSSIHLRIICPPWRRSLAVISVGRLIQLEQVGALLLSVQAVQRALELWKSGQYVNPHKSANPFSVDNWGDKQPEERQARATCYQVPLDGAAVECGTLGRAQCCRCGVGRASHSPALRDR